MPGMFKIPVWLAGPLILLGIAWLGIGWAFSVGLWIIGLVFAAIYALIVSRRQVSIPLESWSKERGMVLWSYRATQRPSVEPRLVWDDAPPEQQAPEATPAVTEP